MSELALYRKWRSQNFDELVGQIHITQTLRNAVSLRKIAHAYLFCGPRGTGKTSMAKIFTKALNCEKGPTPNPCNACDLCAGITRGTVLDCIEIDAASNRGIDEIRELREKVKFPPTQCRYKVYIIDEVHMLTPEAFNALLKTLEEPPPNTVFILCTTEPHKLLPTVISRCQRFDFKKIGAKTIQSRLDEICAKENLKAEPGVLFAVARSADGSLRDALSLLDQLRTFSGDEIKKEEAVLVLGQTPQQILSSLTRLTAQGDLKDLLVSLHDILNQGSDLPQIIRDWQSLIRKLLLEKVAPGVLDLTEEETEFIASVSPAFQQENLYRILRILSELRGELRYSPHPVLSAEMSLMRMMKAQWEPSLEGIRQRVDALENSPAPKIESPAAVTLAAPPSLETVQKKWPDLLEKLRISRSNAYGILQQAKPVKMENDRLSLSFKLKFPKDMAVQKKEEIQKILKEAFRAEITIGAELEAANHEAFVKEAEKNFEGAVLIGEVKDAQS